MIRDSLPAKLYSLLTSVSADKSSEERVNIGIGIYIGTDGSCHHCKVRVCTGAVLIDD